MKKLFICCGAGVATSTVAVTKIKNWLNENNLIDKVLISQGTVAEIPSMGDDIDLIISTSQVSGTNKPVISGLPLLTGVGINKVFDSLRTHIE
ncbi:PTS sugar transporter subunit IIB [Vibrio mediterranei]|jgi:PTS system galactitol-specific IIB component